MPHREVSSRPRCREIAHRVPDDDAKGPGFKVDPIPLTNFERFENALVFHLPLSQTRSASS